MTGLDPITVADAGPVMAEAMGLHWEQDRPTVVKYLNKYRELLYTMYDSFKLFDNVFHCICVNSFPQICVSDCDCSGDTYKGVTLPNDILSVEAVWYYGRPLSLRSRWRETHTGIGLLGPRVEALEMAETFCTERDLKTVTKIKLFTEREEDADKVVYIDVIGKNNRQQRLSFTLVNDGWAVSPVAIKKIVAVVLPSDRVGCVRLAQNDGYELSIYAPWESIPNYKRMKLADSCCSAVVLVQGIKKFQKVYFDHDIVEVGNNLIIESAGRFFKFGENTVETKEIQRASFDKSEMAALMKGLIARHKGSFIQDGSPFKGNFRYPKKTLPGYQ